VLKEKPFNRLTGLFLNRGHPAIADVALIAAAQRAEHYEIAGYGTARTLAEMMGDSNAAQVLDRIAKEEVRPTIV
jgi:ferritin-like metal-binding protein YciE